MEDSTLRNEKIDLETRIIAELQHIRKSLPNGELTVIIRTLTDLKSDLSEVKHTMLNPEDGVIVKTNKNTEFRIKAEKESSEIEKRLSKTETHIEALSGWKNSVNKALWLLGASTVGFFFKILFETIKNITQ